MKVLLDTHVFIWSVNGAEDKLGVQARRMLEKAEGVIVSSVSVVEIHIKSMIGKLQTSGDVVGDARELRAELHSFSPEEADALKEFPELARHDPFDRMLLAQAKASGYVLMTADEVVLRCGYDFVVDARL